MNRTDIGTTENQIYSYGTENQQPTGSSEVAGAQNTYTNCIHTEAQNVATESKNVDIAEYGNTATQNGTAKQHSETEIEQRLKPIFDKYGVSYSIDIVRRLHKDNNIDNLLKSNDVEFKNRMDNLAKCIEKAFIKHYDKNTKTVDLDKAIKTAIEYKIASAFGWVALDKYEQAKEEYSFTDKKGEKHYFTLTGAVLGKDVDVTKLSPEEIQKKVDEYFAKKFKKYLEFTHGNKDEAMKLQLQNLAVLLANTPDNEKEYFKNAIKKFVDKVEPLKEFFESIKDPEVAARIADGYTPDELIRLGRAQRQLIYRNMSKAGLNKHYKDWSAEFKQFYKENRDIIARIYEKRESGNELTEEEQKILAKLEDYIDSEADLTIGTAGNRNIDKKDKQQLLAEMNNFAMEYPTYRQYLESIANYVNSPNADLNIAIEDFNELMQAATGGNYSTVVNDIANGTKTDLKLEPVSVEGTSSIQETSSYSTESGSYTTITPEAVQQSQQRIDELNQKYMQQPKDETPVLVKNDDETISANTTKITSNKGLKKFLATVSNAYTKIVTGHINVLSTAAKDAVVESYKIMDDGLKCLYLSIACSEFFGEFLHNTDSNVVASYLENGGKGNSFDRTKEMQEMAEEQYT